MARYTICSRVFEHGTAAYRVEVSIERRLVNGSTRVVATQLRLAASREHASCLRVALIEELKSAHVRRRDDLVLRD